MPCFTYDLATNIGQVRFLITDTDIDGYVFEDAEINYALTSSSNNVKLAAATLFKVLAGSRAKLAVRVGRGSVNEDLTQVAKELRTQAALWEEEAAEDDGQFQAIISPSYDRFSTASNYLMGRRGQTMTDENPDTVKTP